MAGGVLIRPERPVGMPRCGVPVAERERQATESSVPPFRPALALRAETAQRAVPAKLENGVEMRVFGEKPSKSASDWVKSASDGIKSVTDLIKSATDLIKLKTDLTESEADLTKSEVDLIKSETDLTQSEADLIKSETDLTKSKTDLIKSVTDLIKSETKLIQSETEFVKKMVKNRHFIPKWLKMRQYGGANGSLALN